MTEFFTLKWGDKYGPQYVNRLYGSLLNHYKKPFTFTCYTDDATQIRDEIQIKDIDILRKYDTDRVFTYEKLILMEKHEKGIWLDLDILIHKDITDISNDDADFKMIWNHWHQYTGTAYGRGNSCHVNSSFVKFNNPQWLIKFTNDNWQKIQWTYKSLDKYLFYQHARNNRLNYWNQDLVGNYNVQDRKLLGKITIFNTSHIDYVNTNSTFVELHQADRDTVALWESYD